ncbi:phosphomannomutase [Aspergillus ruber CBS 135680]|uniref:Phosphomannomutase n=1 Tax=Aspergillus ruber (strain CBS 135680) TaxID=1388766 RepID=A0A017SMV3_ASPRC|nr:phosphomannomutase [Aspergillus ruber CBS 135680]EYE98318.1 phosphomannomutase [Aspergillus ruber CBS 135680]
MADTKNNHLPLEARPMKNTICLFDLDGTLFPEKQVASQEMHSLLGLLRQKCAIGYQQQLSTPSTPVVTLFDFCFPENGVTAFRMGTPLPGTTFIGQVGEMRYKELVNWVLRYIADLDIPIKRGTFVEFRKGNVNISPIGQGANYALERQFSNLGLRYAMGGKTCFDAFPVGWDKTYCLRHVEAEEERSGVAYDEIHFFGDKIYEGGNDFELYMDQRTIGHVVNGPEDTIRQVYSSIYDTPAGT